MQNVTDCVRNLTQKTYTTSSYRLRSAMEGRQNGEKFVLKRERANGVKYKIPQIANLTMYCSLITVFVTVAEIGKQQLPLSTSHFGRATFHPCAKFVLADASTNCRYAYHHGAVATSLPAVRRVRRNNLRGEAAAVGSQRTWKFHVIYGRIVVLEIFSCYLYLNRNIRLFISVWFFDLKSDFMSTWITTTTTSRFRISVGCQTRKSTTIKRLQ